ncbi:hypothetical protein AcW1_009814 [Taiwanofungus camphoratus]|nr:hypothetical protein AcW1_009814 [Antrodia cinnamomea]
MVSSLDLINRMPAPISPHHHLEFTFLAADSTSTAMATLPSSTPAAELRHITSNTNLASPARERRISKRNSQLLRTHRLGSRSPSSIPSSPTSV